MFCDRLLLDAAAKTELLRVLGEASSSSSDDEDDDEDIG